LLAENYWTKGKINYNGVQFSDVFMNYDLVKTPESVLVVEGQITNEQGKYNSAFKVVDST